MSVINKKLLTNLARLESQLDYYETEFANLNQLLIKCGFAEGLKTLRESAHEFVKPKPKKKKRT